MPNQMCPKCETKYDTKYKNLQQAKKNKNNTYIEQHLSGICSDKCWYDCSENEIMMFKYINPIYSKSAQKVYIIN